MTLLTILLGVCLVFLLALIASVVLTHFSHTGEMTKAALGDIVQGRARSGVLLDTVGEAFLLEFEGLDTPSTLILAADDSRIQAVDPKGRLKDEGVEGTSLLPGDLNGMSGRERKLGTFRVIGILEELPLRHLKIEAIERI